MITLFGNKLLELALNAVSTGIVTTLSAGVNVAVPNLTLQLIFFTSAFAEMLANFVRSSAVKTLCVSF